MQIVNTELVSVLCTNPWNDRQRSTIITTDFIINCRFLLYITYTRLQMLYEKVLPGIHAGYKSNNIFSCMYFSGVEDAFCFTPKVMTVSFHKYCPGFYPGKCSSFNPDTFAGLVGKVRKKLSPEGGRKEGWRKTRAPRDLPHAR